MEKLIKFTVLTISLIFFTSSYGQNNKETIISGVVKNASNKPIKNTYIFIDNVKQKVKTNSKGFYSIKLKDEPTKITFLSIEYGSVDYKYIKGVNKINILFEKEKPTIASSKKQKSKKIKFTEYRNLFDYLRGQPGVEINNNNEIRIRGAGSLNGSSSPIFVVNGKQEILANILGINPINIKKIKVLKNADELAVYGVRGANGVILITII